MAYAVWQKKNRYSSLVVIGDTQAETENVDILKKLLGVIDEGDRVGVIVPDIEESVLTGDMVVYSGSNLIVYESDRRKAIEDFFMGFAGDEKDQEGYGEYDEYDPLIVRCSSEMYYRKRDAHESDFYEKGRALRNRLKQMILTSPGMRGEDFIEYVARLMFTRMINNEDSKA